jgi:hypothetical protein
VIARAGFPLFGGHRLRVGGRRHDARGADRPDGRGGATTGIVRGLVASAGALSPPRVRRVGVPGRGVNAAFFFVAPFTRELVEAVGVFPRLCRHQHRHRLFAAGRST